MSVRSFLLLETYVVCLSSRSDTVMEYLINVTTAPAFRPWEVSDLTARVKLDKELAKQTPQIGMQCLTPCLNAVILDQKAVVF